jgi:predicted NBD/HSP70 family sugar kinase
MPGAEHDREVGLGIQVNYSSIIAIASDADGNIEHSRMIDGEFGDSDPEAVLAQAGELAREMIAACSVKHHILGVGLALPGLVNSREGYLEFAPNLGWRDIYPAAMLGFNGVNVTVANNAKLGAIAEWQVAGEPNFIYLTIGTGIGGAIMDQGRLFRGERGWDGEIGHMTVDPRGPACTCGGRGCLEQYAGKTALFNNAGIDPHASVSDFINSLNEGNQAAVEAFDTATIALAHVLANVITLVDIRHLVIEGELAELAPRFKDAVTRLVEDAVIAGHKVPLHHQMAMAGDFGPALGGALLAHLDY